MNTLPLRNFKRQEDVRLRDGKYLPTDDVLFNHLINKFVRNEAELLIPHVAGGVYYRDIAREKAKIRNSVEEHNKTPVTSRLRQTHLVKRMRRARRPPSVKPRTVKKLKQALNVLRDTQQMAEKKAYIQEVRKREEDEIRAARAQFNKFKRHNVSVVTKNNERFEPTKLTSSMLQHHNHIMAEKFKHESQSAATPSPGPFITKMKAFRLETESTPDLSNLRSNKRNKTKSKRPASVQNANSKSNSGSADGSRDASGKQRKSFAGNDVSAAGSRESSRGRSRLRSRESSRGRSRLRSRELAGSTTDIDVEIGVLPLLSENPAYRDWETSHASLRYLEEKIKAFNLKQDSNARRSARQLPPLVRFECKDETSQQPKPGGRVLVKSKPCEAVNTTRYTITNHQHARANMVPRLAEYDVMRKQRMIRHMILDDERQDWFLNQEKVKRQKQHRLALIN